MNRTFLRYTKILLPSVVLILITACSVSTTKPYGAESVREKLTQLQADSQLASRAQVAIKEAETATRVAEQPEKDKALAAHRVYMADHKVDIAMAVAQSRFLEDQRKDLIAQRESARLDSRTREADRAHEDAKAANEDARAANENAALARQRNADLQQQLVELNAEKTERGMVITLGDLLFETGKSELKSSTVSNLDKLSAFLTENQDRTLIIEGYTDNVGSDEYNLGLSQRRAESVQLYLVKKGIASDRMIVSGKGETGPVATNDSPMGRQQNRRVEVVLPDSAS